jgi:hypothetical protein
VQIHIRLGGNLPEFLHRLHHSGFVIRQHDSDQPGVGPDRASHIVGIDQATAIDGNVRDLAAAIFQMLRRIQHGMMLDGRSNDVITRLRQPEEREVVAFRAAAGKDDFRRLATQQASNRFPCALHRSPCLLSMMMDGRRVAKVLAEVRAHSLENLGQHGSGRVIVEVNPPHRYLYCTVWRGGERVLHR